MKNPLLCRSLWLWAMVWLGLRGLAQELPPVTISWTGAEDTDWANAANWEPARVPNGADHVAVDGADGLTVSLTGTRAIGSLRLGLESTGTVRLRVDGRLILGTGGQVGTAGQFDLVGSLDGAPLSVAGGFDWLSGRLEGVVRIASTGRLLLPNANGRGFSSGNGQNPARIENDGVARWLGGTISGWDNSRIVNRGEWRLEAEGALVNYCCGGARNQFENAGRLIKTGTTGETSLGELNLEQSGLIQIDAGTLVLNSASSWSGTPRVAGAGRLQLPTANHTWSGTVTLDAVVELNGGSHYGELTVNGPVPLEWTRGRLLGKLTVGAGSELRIVGLDGKSFSSGNNTNPAMIENLGLVRWTGGTISAWDNSQFVNRGRWQLDEDGAMADYCCGGTLPLFINFGTLAKTGGTGVSQFLRLRLDNSGTVEVGTGEFHLRDSMVWQDGSQLNGPGTLRLVTGSAEWKGRFTLGGKLDLAGANLHGTPRFTGPVPATWTSGRLLGRLTIDAGAELRITGPDTKSLSSGNNASPAGILNQGTVTWDGGGVYGWDTSEIRNDGVWQFASGGLALDYCCGGGTPTFLNYGTTRSLTTETVDIARYRFHQYGLLQSGAGQMRLLYESYWHDGNQVAGEGSILLVGGSATLDGLTLLNGSLQWEGVNVYGEGRVRGPVPITWNSGQLYGELTVEVGARLNLRTDGGHSISSGNNGNPATLLNCGTVSSSGSGIYAWNNSRIVNEGIWRLEADGIAMQYCCGGTTPQWINQGVITKTGGTGASVIGTVNLEQRGTLSAVSGEIQVADTSYWYGGSVVQGLGTVSITGGTLNGAGLVTLRAPLLINGGNVAGAVSVAGPAPLRWLNGRLFNSLLIESNATLEIPGSLSVSSGNNANPASITNRGRVRQTGASSVVAWNGSLAVNQGSWLLETDGPAFAYCCGGSVPTFVNEGEFAKVAGENLSTFSEGTFTSSGLVRVESGTLQLARNSSVAGQTKIRIPGRLTSYQNLTLGGDFTLLPPPDPQPGPGASFSVLNGPNRIGQFATITVPQRDDGAAWSLDYVPGQLLANVVDDPCVTSSLAGWWPGEGSAADLSGKHPGSLVGAVQFAPGVVGRAFQLTGAGEYVHLGSWSIGTEWSTEAWVQLASIQPGRRTILGGVAACRDWGLVVTDGRLGAVYRPPSGCTASALATEPAEPGLWYHVVATGDGSNVRFYLDGQLIRTEPTEPGYVGFEGVLLGNSWAGGESFAGLVDEAVIHQRALGAAEIAAIYNAGTRGRCARSALEVGRVDPTGPVATPVTRLQIRFNQSIDLTSFSPADLRLSGPTGPVNLAAAVVTPTDDPRSYAVNLTSPLSAEGEYVLITGPDILDASGQGMAGGFAHTNRFTVDTTGPRIVSLTPASPAIGRISFWDLTLDAPIQLPALTAADFTVTGDGFPGIQSITLLSNAVYRVQFPRPLPAGTYSVTIGPNLQDLAGNLLDQDRDGTLGEPVEDVFTTSFQVQGADLAVLSVLAPPSGLLGQSVPVVFVLTNRGPTTAVGPWNNRIVLADDAAGTAPRTLGSLTFSGNLASGAALTLTQQVILVNGTAGTRHLGVVADVNQTVIDPDRENNTRFATIPTVIFAADLRVASVETTNRLTLGSAFLLKWRTTNPGGSDTIVSSRDAVYLSPTADSLNNAVLLGTFPADPVPAGGGYDRTVSLTVPLRPDQLPPGAWFVVVVSDLDNAQPEADEGNNRGSLAVQVQLPPLPDLTVQDLLAPQFSGAGVETEFRWTVRNAGNQTAEGAWNERLSLTAPGGAPFFLAEFRFTNSLPPGESLVRTQFVVLPPNLSANSYNFTLAANPTAELVESTPANNASSTVRPTVVPAALRLTAAQDSVTEGDPAILLTVFRNTDPSVPLTVGLTNPLPAELEVPASVVIPAGQDSATFPVRALPDGLTDGSRVISLEAGAEAHASALLPLQVLDVDRPLLTLETPPNRVTEGRTLPVTLRRTGPTDSETLVLLRSSDTTRLKAPTDVTIPIGAASVSFALLAPDNAQIEQPLEVALIAQSGGFLGATNRVTVLDDDLPTVTATIPSPDLNEAAGPQAGNATFRRTGNLTRPLVLDLVATVDDLLLYPATVTFEVGQDAATIPIGVVNDNQVNGRRQVAIRSFIRVTGRLETAAEAPPLDLAVVDDEGPSLSLALSSDLAPEGRSPALTATIRRNTGTNAPLAVTLRSLDTTEATVPASVVIPVGAFTAVFPVATVDDGVSDGSQTVTLEVTAPGFTSAKAAFVVSDSNLPDLSVTRVQVPVSGDSEAAFNATYRVENRGNQGAQGPFVTRVFLSADPVPGGDTLLGQFNFEGNLPAGQFFEQTSQFRLPRLTGKYWIVAVTDAGQAITEIREDNNTQVAAVPIEVKPAYVATVVADLEQGLPGTPIPLRGRAVRAGSQQGVPNAVVNVHVAVRGSRRILTALTDADGNYTVTFQPLPGEAGRYEIGAAHPGEATAAVQDRFSLLGFQAVPGRLRVEMGVGSADISVAELVNLSEIPLTGLGFETIAVPGHLQVQPSVNLTTLGGSSTNFLVVRVEATGAATTFGTFGLRVTSTEGPTVEIPVDYVIRVPRPLLVSEPRSLLAGMTRGRQTSVAFELANLGGEATDPVFLSLPDFPWLAVAGDNPLPSIKPGETNRVTLLLTPPADLELGAYAGALALNAANASLSLPFEFRALSDAKGSLVVQVEDEFTYYAEGSPRVTNATVTVRDLLSGVVITNGVTDSRGEFRLNDIPEAYYELVITAPKHSTDRSNQLVMAGQLNSVTTFISRQTVEYNWTVVPTEIEDRTQIVIETTFETVVPVPVVTVEPSYIDLTDMVGDELQVDIAISNHGLIAAQEMVISFDSHPDFSFTPLISDIGTLPAQSSLVVPMIVRRIGGGTGSRTAQLAANGYARPAAGNGPCWGGGQVRHVLKCGKLKPSYGNPISIRTGSNCGGAASNWIATRQGGGPYYDGFGSGGVGSGGSGSGGVGSGGSGSGYGGRISITPKENCDCDPATFVPKCWEFGVSGGLFGAAASAATTAFLSPVNGQADLKLNGLVKYCSCCDEEGEGEFLEGSAEIELSVTLGIPIVGKRLHIVRPEPGGTVTIDAGIGCDLIIGGKIKGSVTGGTDCHFKNPKICATLSGEIPGGVSCGAAGRIAFKPTGGKEESQGVNLSVGLTSGMGGSYTYCQGKGSGKICISAVNAEAVAQASFGAISVGGKYTEVLRAEECYPLGGAASLAELPEHVRDAARQMIEAVEKAAKEYEAKAARLQAPALAAAATRQAQQARIGQRQAAPAAEEGICARVKLRLEQELVLTRSAFQGTLELINRDTLNQLSDISVNIQVFDTNGHSATDLFGFRPPVLQGLNAVDGTGELAPGASGNAQFILVPTRDAAPDGPRQYGVGGNLSYRAEGRIVTVPLAPVTITVFPDPRLVVQYFHQRDVFSDDPFTRDIIEPTVPYNLAVMVANRGKGDARNVRIISSQPVIVENEKGLAIDFKIIATEVAGKSLTPSLTADFGHIPPGDIGIGRWLMTSTLQGLFLDYKATFQHLDNLGKTNLSLVEAVTIHEMNRLVEAGGAFADGKPDFLVNDEGDPEDLPDTLYLSDGRTNSVRLVQQPQVDGSLAGANRQVQLSAPVGRGWSYFRVADPAKGAFRLKRVTRSDGFEVSVNTNVWITDRTFIGGGKRPRYEHNLHLLDHDSTGRYVLEYEDLPSVDLAPPISTVAALPGSSYSVIPLLWTGGDEPGGSGLAYFDVFVSIDDGPFTPWLQQTKVRGAIYRGEPGRRYAFYTVATDVAGNHETPPLQPDAVTRVNLANTAPVVAAINSLTVDEGQPVVVDPSATDVDLPGQSLTWLLGADAPAGAVINNATGRVTWETGEANGPGATTFSVIVRDNGVPALFGTNRVTVTVREINTAPSLVRVPDVQVNEAQQLVIEHRATDGDLPAQSLRYSLVGVPPTGVTLDGVTGVLRWRPGNTQGGQSYALRVRVTDNGSPALTDERTYQVTVRDTQGDFAVRIGRTNVFRGQSAAVPVNLESPLELLALRFELAVPVSALDQLQLVPVAAELGTATLRPDGPNRSRLEFTAGSGQTFLGAQRLANLQFTSPAGTESVAVTLNPEAVVAQKLDGTFVGNPPVFPGRVFVVGDQPLLDLLWTGTAPELRLYGKSGLRYQLETSSRLAADATWTPAGTHTLNSDVQLIPFTPGATGDGFFRSRRLP